MKTSEYTTMSSYKMTVTSLASFSSGLIPSSNTDFARCSLSDLPSSILPSFNLKNQSQPLISNENSKTMHYIEAHSLDKRIAIQPCRFQLYHLRLVVYLPPSSSFSFTPQSRLYTQAFHIKFYPVELCATKHL